MLPSKRKVNFIISLVYPEGGILIFIKIRKLKKDLRMGCKFDFSLV